MANKFTNFKFTTEGKDTLTEVLAAKGSIAITQVYTFATKLTDALVFTQLSSLGPKQIKPVGTVSAQSNTVETRLQIDNADLTSDYNLQGIALVGTFNKTNFILGYINTNEATNVPAYSGNQVQTIALDVSFAISDTSVITINTQTAGMLTVADYNALVAFIKDQVAPLSVDKKVVHLTNNEIIDGIKTFKQKITGSISGNANTVDYINIHQITANIDLNTLTTNGNYLSVLETKTTSNKPGGTSEQYSLISTGNMQLFSDIKTDKVYIRNQITSTTFTSWKIILEDVDQTLNAQYNFTKTPTVNSKPVAIQADLQNETTNRTNADKTINNSLATEVSDRKSGDATNANAVQAEATSRSQADSSAAAALNTEKAARSAADVSLSNSLASEASVRSAADSGLTNQFNTVNSGLNSESVARSAADETLTKAVRDTQKKVQTETTNRTNADNKIDSAAVHKAGNESISGTKSFTSAINGDLSGNANTANTLKAIELTDGADLTNATSSGRWYSAGAQVSGIPDNSGAYFTLDQAVWLKNGMRILIDNYGNAWYSTRSSSVWSSWHKLSNSNLYNEWTETNQFDKQIIAKAGINGDLSGNASTADKLHTARTIGGVNFDGGSNINLPGVNMQGNQNTTGNAASATKLQVARKVNGTAFDGTKDISVNAANDSNLVHQTGNESISGYKTFGNTLTVNGISKASYFYKSVANTNANPIIEVDDANSGSVRGVGYYYSGDANGAGVTFGAGGLTIIGGGESAKGIMDIISAGTNDTNALPFSSVMNESTVITSDQYIYFMPGQQSGINYAPMFRFSSGGYLDKWNGTSWIPIIGNDATLLASDNTVVHNSGNETIAGTKSFSSTVNGSVSGNAGSATKLQTARSVGGVNFDGTANINLPGVNTQGNQNTTGNAATATKLQTARKVNGTPFDGTKDISINAANDSNIVHQSGNESIAGSKTFTGTTNFNGNVSSRGASKIATVKYQSVTMTFYETPIGVQVTVSGNLTNFKANQQGSASVTFGTIPSNITNPPIRTYIVSSTASGIPGKSNNIPVSINFSFDPDGTIGFIAAHGKENDASEFSGLWSSVRGSTYWIK